MSESMVESFDAMSPEDREETAKKLTEKHPDIFSGVSESDRTKLWMTLIVGLLVVALGAMGTAVALVLNGNDASALFALATAVVGGLVGLFAKSPTG